VEPEELGRREVCLGPTWERFLPVTGLDEVVATEPQRVLPFFADVLGAHRVRRPEQLEGVGSPDHPFQLGAPDLTRPEGRGILEHFDGVGASPHGQYELDDSGVLVRVRHKHYSPCPCGLTLRAGVCVIDGLAGNLYGQWDVSYKQEAFVDPDVPAGSLAV
jgi:hypothetical protein